MRNIPTENTLWRIPRCILRSNIRNSSVPVTYLAAGQTSIKLFTKRTQTYFYLTFNWFGLIGICSRAQKCAKRSSNGAEAAFDLVLRTQARVGLQAERRESI